MGNPKLWEVKQLTQNHQLERQTWNENQSIGSESSHSISPWIVPSTLLKTWSWWPSATSVASVDSSLLLTTWDSQHFAFSYMPAVQRHKTWPSCSQRKETCAAAHRVFCHHFQRVQRPSLQPILPPTPRISTNPTAPLPNLKIHTVHTHKTHKLLETLYCSEEFLKVSPSTATVRKEKLANIQNSTNIW